MTACPQVTETVRYHVRSRRVESHCLRQTISHNTESGAIPTGPRVAAERIELCHMQMQGSAKQDLHLDTIEKDIRKGSCRAVRGHGPGATSTSIALAASTFQCRGDCHKVQGGARSDYCESTGAAFIPDTMQHTQHKQNIQGIACTTI